MASVYRKLMWNEQITVFHRINSIEDGKQKVSWEKSVYEDCFWGNKIKWHKDGESIIRDNQLIVRIPADKDAIVALGDIVVRGSIEDEIAGSGTNIKQAYKDSCFEIAKTTDNSKLKNTAHLLITDKG